ncbi:cytochrome P450 [Streptomyces sp. NPDC087659]|uniref:cytochrome P450 n=1 Tax=Streptomyces sp. NPDC087659 TaxID=3365801 RepID=UPI0037FEEBFD
MTFDHTGAVSPPPGCPAHQGGTRRVTPMHGSDFAANPTAVYEGLRREGPVAAVELAPGVSAALVTSYSTALRVMRDPGVFAKDPRRWRALSQGRVPRDSPVLPLMAYRPTCMFSDGDDHRRLRAVVDDSLSRIDPNRLREEVESSADALIDAFAPYGTADLLADYASPLIFHVISSMFGCPPDLADRLLAALTEIFNAGSAADQADVDAAQCFAELVALKRAQPGADMTSWMIAHPAQLNDLELIHQIAILYGAGTEPGGNLIANSLRLLLADDRFSGSLSGGTLPIGDALDEVLWKDPPMANFSVHYPVHDVLLDGVWLRAGDPVVISLAASNNDPALQSQDRNGNRAHLAWGAGPHSCPAQPSARLIAEVAIERLLDRLPDLDLAIPADHLTWRPGPFHRSLQALPVVFPPEDASARQPRAAGGEAIGPDVTAAPPMLTSGTPEREEPAGPTRLGRFWQVVASRGAR